MGVQAKRCVSSPSSAVLLEAAALHGELSAPSVGLHQWHEMSYSSLSAALHLEWKQIVASLLARNCSVCNGTCITWTYIFARYALGFYFFLDIC